MCVEWCGFSGRRRADPEATASSCRGHVAESEVREDFASSLYRSLTTATPYKMPVNSAEDSKRDAEVKKSLNLSQRGAYQREKEALMYFGLSPEEASEKAAEYVTADTYDAGGVTVTGVKGIRNMLGDSRGSRRGQRAR